MRLLSSFLLSALALAGQVQPSPVWQKTAAEQGLGYASMRKDPPAGGILMPQQLGSGIFMTDISEYCITPSVCGSWGEGQGQFTHIAGSGQLVDTTPADLPVSYTATNPGGLMINPVYVSGLTVSGGTGYCILSSFNGGGSGATAFLSVVNNVPYQIIMTAVGTGYGSAPTTATASNNSPLTCSGTVTLTSSLGNLPNRPGARHIVGQIAVDSKRNIMWLGGGITRASEYSTGGSFAVSGTAATCGGSCNFPTDGSWNGLRVYIPGSGNCATSGAYCTVSVVNSPTSMTFSGSGPGTLPGSYQMFFVDPGMNASAGIWGDLFYLTLNADPRTDTWTRLFPTHTPLSISGGSYYYQGTFAADPDDDVLMSFEGSHAWIYCTTLGNPGGAGVLNSSQTAAGNCTADDWAIVSTSTGIPAPYSGVVYDPHTKLFYIFGGSVIYPTVQSIYAYNPGGSTRSTGTVSVSSHAFVQLCTSACTNPPGEYNGSTIQTQYSAIDLYPSPAAGHNVLLYHRSSQNGVSTPQDLVFDPAAGSNGVWTTLTTTTAGDGNTNGVSIACDPVTIICVTGSSGTSGTYQGNIEALSSTLTLQESLYAGDLTGTSMSSNVLSYGGIARTNEPWCMGIPIADSASLTTTQYLTLSGQSFGQFRILGKWPDGNIKWLKACGIAPSLSAGSTASTTLANNGSANTSVGTNNLPNPSGGATVSDTTGYGFGGANMGTDNGSTITVSTNGGSCGSGSAICFTIKKANFNGIDIATIGSTSIIATSSSATRGLVLTGPAATGTSTVVTGTVACPCTITTGVNDTLNLAANSANLTTVTLTAGSGVSAATLAGEISASGITASASGNNVVLTANTTGRTGNVQIYAANANATLGFTPGAYSGSVSCDASSGGSACSTVYSSANDSASTCHLEENGPVLTVVECQGSHIDGSSNPYMQFTAREYFYQGKSDVKVVVSLRNANWSTTAGTGGLSTDCFYNSTSTQCNGGSYDSAAKGIRSYELRLDTGLSGTLTYTLATDTSPQTGSLSSSDFAYIYQGQANWMVPGAAPDTQYCQPGTSYCANQYTTDTGYVAKKNSTTLASGTASVVPVGWFDCTDSGSNGVEIGIEEFASQWPASLECFATNSELRVGLFSARSSTNIYMPWPMWRVFGDVYLNFHVGALASQQNEYLKQQHFLLARPTITYLNSTSVWPYPLIDGSTEDTFYLAAHTAASPSLTLSHFCYQSNSTNCTPDRGQTYQSLNANGLGMGDYRYYAWSQGGSLNQEDFRWFDLMKFIQRGYAGRFLNTRYFVRYLSEMHWAHADGTSATDNTINGFTWRSRSFPETEGTIGSPEQMISADTGSSEITRQTNVGAEFGLSASHVPQWQDYLHEHDGAQAEYYFNTGDEAVKEAAVPLKDYYLNTTTAAYGTSPTRTTGITRAYGVWLLYTGRWALYSAAIGASADATSFLNSGQYQFDTYVNVQSCQGGIRPGGTVATYYPTGCFSADAGNASVGSGSAQGTATASGTAVSWASGTTFNPGITSAPATAALWPPGSNILIGGNTYQIANVSSSTALTTTASVTGCSSPCTYKYANGVGGGAVPGISLERGDHQANSAGGGYCAWNDGTDSGLVGGNYRIQQPFQQAILIDGLENFRYAKGPTWSNYNRARDLAYGLALNNTLESVNDDGASHWSDGTGYYNGMAYFRTLDFPVVCPTGTVNTDSALLNYGSFGSHLYDQTGTPNGDQNIYPTWLEITKATGDASSWSRFFNIIVQQGSNATSAWLGDWGMPLLSNSIYNMNNPPTATLQPVTISTFTDLGSGNYQLTYTPPVGTCQNDPGCLRIKWATRTITAYNQLLGFDPMNTFTWTTDPATNIPWFGANNAEATNTIPIATPGAVQTVTISTGGTTGLVAGNFSVNAMASGCNITPTSLGPYTNTQTISVTMTANNCGGGTLTWTSSTLPTGSSGCNSVTGTTCVISGTLSAASTFSSSISVSDGGSNTASIAPSITVNAAPTCCSPTSPLPAGTQSVAYSQSITGALGTAPLTYAITTGTFCSGAITLSSGGLLSGTCGTPGTYSGVVVKSTDANGIVSSGMTYSLTINAGGSTHTADVSDLILNRDVGLGVGSHFASFADRLGGFDKALSIMVAMLVAPTMFSAVAK